MENNVIDASAWQDCIPQFFVVLTCLLLLLVVIALVLVVYVTVQIHVVKSVNTRNTSKIPENNCLYQESNSNGNWAMTL